MIQDYISVGFYLFVAVLLVAYYVLPFRMRWCVLLAGSIGFYCLVAGKMVVVLFAMGIVSFGAALFLEKESDRGRQKVLRGKLFVSVAIILVPFILTRTTLFGQLLRDRGLVAPLGISFFTLQIIAYLFDVAQKSPAEHNFFKYLLFISFFPQIVQGPIPRYGTLQKQLVEGHSFQEKGFVKGCMLIIWGFFLKMMIADKAGIVVDCVFEHHEMYQGSYVLVAGVLYSIQLYADFSGCVSISKGVAALFGIRLQDNFRHPYFSTSIKEFWQRWHISLSSWLRDYVYIPLGGNRKGKFRKYVNLVITFLVSGLWHGSGLNFLLWGMMHACYQIGAVFCEPVRAKCYQIAGIRENSGPWFFLKRLGCFFWVMFAWIVFRAERLSVAVQMIKSLFLVYNPWIIADGSLLKLGLSGIEWAVLLFSVYVLYRVSTLQEKESVGDIILKQPFIVRWSIYIGAILLIYVFGTYGYGFDAKAFIYGGF